MIYGSGHINHEDHKPYKQSEKGKYSPSPVEFEFCFISHNVLFFILSI